MGEDTEDLGVIVARLDERQKAQALRLSAQEARTEEVRIVAERAESKATKAELAAEGMPGMVREALREELRRRSLSAREWITIVLAVLVVFLSIPAAVQSFKAITSPPATISGGTL